MTKPDIDKLYHPDDVIPKHLEPEIVPIVNHADEIQGYMLKESAHRHMLPDRIAAIMLTTPDGNGFFLQQRASDKKQFPNALTLAATGHVNYVNGKTESYLQAAFREFQEELGQPCPPLQSLGKYMINAGHHGMYQVFRGFHAGETSDFHPDEKEVSRVLLVSRRQLPHLAEQFTPPARKILDRMGYLG